MDRKEAIAGLKDCQRSLDQESAHYAADEILCKLLVSLGYGDVVKEFEAIDKWYA